MVKSLKHEIQQIALKLAAQQPTFQIGAVLELLSGTVSRQYVQPILKQMVEDKQLVYAGKGRAAAYAAPEKADVLFKRYSRSLINKNLEEHIVFDALKQEAGFLKDVRENVFSIFDYSFQEMLNNAIDHSGSKKISITTQCQDRLLTFEVSDTGIGVFSNIASKLKLKNELEAIGELMKGKTTTDPEHHTGEGIFFSSKAADVFILESHNLRLTVDNSINDVFIEELKPYKNGTRVRLFIKASSKRHLSDIFRKYQTNPEDHAFNQTEIRVKLFEMGTVYISRSQARRVMSGLDKKFQSVVLDFEGVQTIGQAFADEVFRVYSNRHPDMSLSAVNAKPGVQFMVDRAKANTKT